MREKARVLWWKITNFAQKSVSFLHLPKIGHKMKRALAWSGAGVVAIGVVVFAGVMLTSTNSDESYAAGAPPDSIGMRFVFGSGYHNCTYDNGLGCAEWLIFGGHPDGHFVNDITEISGVDGNRITWASAICLDPGAAYPSADEKYVDLYKTTTNEMEGWVEYYGFISDEWAQNLGVTIRVSWEFGNSQPVTSSEAVKEVNTGTRLSDKIWVHEASEVTGKAVTLSSDSRWSKNGDNYASAKVWVAAYGPYGSSGAERYPSDSLVPQDEYFSLTPKTVENEKPKAKDIVIIGDMITPTISELSNINSTMFNSQTRYYNDGTTLSSIRSRIASSSGSANDIDVSGRGYVVVAVGLGDISSTTSVSTTTYVNRIKEVFSAIETENHDVKGVAFIEAFNGSGASNYTLLSSSHALQNTLNYKSAITRVIQEDRTGKIIDTMGWSYSSSPSALDCKVNTNGVITECRYNASIISSNGYAPTASGKTLYINNMVASLDRLSPSTTVLEGGEAYLGAATQTCQLSENGLCKKMIGQESFNTGDRGDHPGTTGWEYTVEFDGNGGEYSDSANWRAGKYYFVSNVRKSDNDWVFLDNWYSPFAEDTETTIVKFQPKVVTNVQENYVSSGVGVYDEAHVWADGNSQTSTNPDDQTYWLKEDSGGYSPVTVCIAAYGPYQTPQAKIVNTNNTTIVDNIPDAANKLKTTTCQEMSPSDNDKRFSFSGSENWGPGYYYFYEYIEKTSQDNSLFIQNSYYSDFNPTGNASGGNAEWIYRKFQPFITSNVENDKPWVDVKEGSTGGEDIVDRVVGRAASSTEEAQNGYQSDVDKDSYWPTYDASAGANAGKYIPIKFKFYICGPFQYPQNEGTTNDMVNPTATNNSNEYQWASGTACNNSTALKTVIRFVTPNSCSTNENVATLSENNFTTDSTGRKSCSINFGKTDTNGNYYQPGYYYFTSEMVLDEQTLTVSSSLGGISTTTVVKNYISSSWKSKFNPLWKDSNTLDEIEWAYVQPQPVARSYAGATQSEDSPNENKWTTRLSYQYTNTENQYKGLQLNCNEHNDMPTWTDMTNDTDFWDKVPSTTLTCENVSDRVYIGATTTKDVNYTTKVVSDNNVDEKNWPQTNDKQSGENGANYETIKYRTKLYGPFASVSSMTNGTIKANPSGGNEAGSTVTIVPGNVSSISGQPVAESCLTSAKYGPNYSDFPAYNATNPNNSLNAYYYQTEKTSISEKGYYKAVFTRDTDIDCADDGSGSLGLLDNSGVPYTTLSLKPGVYVSVVEVWKSDMNENNRYDSGDTSNTDAYFDDNGDRTGDTKTINSADKRGQISGGEVRDLMANDFHSKWADPYETIFVPPDTDIWTLRGNMDNFKVDWGARYHDQYWTTGWSNWCTTYKDLFGNCMAEHNDDNSSYKGEKDYFAPDKDPTERAGQIRVDLYGAFELRPDTAECSADKRIATWYVDANDTDQTGDSTKLENMLPSSGDGWYVYVFSYGGDDRVPALQTKCSDPDEQFYLGEPAAPELETQIEIESSSKKAPSVVSDTVKVTGWVEKDSVVKLSLFRRGGVSHNPNSDTQICSVQFKIPSSIDPVQYSVSDYMDKNGYVFSSNTPDDVAADPNRCFAEEAGHYYWYEEFYDPDGKELQPPRADGPNEWADIEKENPEVTTMADASVMVGEPFHDTAYVKIPEGDTRKYNLYMRAYGPTTGAPVCDTTNKTNLLFESGPHEVTKTGTYPSAYTSSLTTGYVYWIETLVDKETDEVVAEGYCGKELEITRVYDTPAPGDTWEWTPGAPLAGDIVLSAVKIVGLIGMLSVGAWQLSDKNSWLMRKISRK